MSRELTLQELIDLEHYLELFEQADFSDLPHYTGKVGGWSRSTLHAMMADVSLMLAWKRENLRRERPVTEQQRESTGRTQTLGEKRVRASFNPSSNSKVDLIKQKTADLIDLIEDYKAEEPTGAEAARCAALAQTHYEDAAMWAVKLVTF